MYFLNINKPKGMTSFDVIRELRKKLKIKQIGHSGTLDPLASGVLQIAVGSATKLLDYLKGDKTYVAVIKFGYETQTYDAEGEKEFIKTPDFTKARLEGVLNSFLGKSMQTPPKYSAVKQNGKKLCDLARKGMEVEIKQREIEIYSIKLLNFNGYDEAIIEVNCKKGTYIRSLIYDIGQILSCGAYMSDLVRIKADGFMLDSADELEQDDFRKINPLDVLPFDKYELSDDELKRVSNGNGFYCSKKFNSDIILLTKNYKLVSIAKISDNQIKPNKVFLGG